MKQITCPKCGRLYPEDAAYCPSCKHPNDIFMERERIAEQKREEEEKAKKRQEISKNSSTQNNDPNSIILTKEKTNNSNNKTYYEDSNLKITKEYIGFENTIMPTPAISFVSYGRKEVSWLKPILMIIAGLILLYICFNYYEIDILNWVSYGLIGFGLFELTQVFIESRKMVFYLVSHSGKDISFEIDGGQEILDAVHNMLDDRSGDNPEKKNNDDIDLTEEGTFEVILNSCDVTKKLTVVKCIYDLLKIDLKEAKEIVDNAPKTVKKCISERAAEKIKKVLEAAGAEIEIRNDQ